MKKTNELEEILNKYCFTENGYAIEEPVDVDGLKKQLLKWRNKGYVELLEDLKEGSTVGGIIGRDDLIVNIDNEINKLKEGIENE